MKCNPEIHYPTTDAYLRMELARLLRRSALRDLASATRLARIWAYSFCSKLSVSGKTLITG